MTVDGDAKTWKTALLHPWTIALVSLVVGIAATVVTTRALSDDRARVGEPFVLDGFEYTLVSLVCSLPGRTDHGDQLCQGVLAIVNQTPDQNPPPNVELKLVSSANDRFSPTERTTTKLAQDIEPGNSMLVDIAFSPPEGLTFHGLDVNSAGGSKTVKTFVGDGVATAGRSSCLDRGPSVRRIPPGPDVRRDEEQE